MSTPPALDEQICFALHAASRRLTQAYREPLSRLGLTYPQYLVLMVLWEQDACTVSALGQRLQLDSGTLSPLVKRLESRGIVRRRHSTEDERRVHVELTDAGRELQGEAEDVQRCVLATLELEPEELWTLRFLARRVAALEPRPVVTHTTP